MLVVQPAAPCQERAEPCAARKRRWGKILLLVGLGVVLAGVPAWLLRGNFRAVLPGRVYRSAQLSVSALRERIAACHLRSVLNLRGANPGEDWYDEECREAAREGVRHYDVATDSDYPPTPDDLRELIGVLDRCERPVLIHCQSGIDRTGLAAAVCVLLSEDGSPEQARAQLGLFYGHQLAWRTRTIRQQAFLEQYEEWLAHNAYGHSPARFREWALRVYCGTPELAQNGPAAPPEQ